MDIDFLLFLNSLPENAIITLPDGYNRHTVKCYAIPVKINDYKWITLMDLQVAESNKQYMKISVTPAYYMKYKNTITQ